MKTPVIFLLFIMQGLAFAESKIEVMPELAKEVNAYTKDNKIPWHQNESYEIKLLGKLDELIPLVRITQGNYHYTLYKLRFNNIKVLEGKFEEITLSFYIERQFPTLSSGIMLKELWPFRGNVILTFKGCIKDDKFFIVSIEIETPQKDSNTTDTIKERYQWEAGQEVERIGVIWPSKEPGGANYHIRCDDKRNPHIISPEIDQLKLKKGTTFWVK